ncbi:NAD+ synthase [uncultured Cocleimonas sp.]|uniref:NAD+ synthase n=1 Tax=uncultured Cocleimonas sp. TaxID=1051587 RepID=UPI0026220BB3|nr:NAD+ synthase [uncultured Cocleimonas sp.]
MSLTVSIAQINPIVGSFKQNFKMISEAILEAQKQNADVVLFPELVITGYPPEDLLFRQNFLRKVETMLQDLTQVAPAIAVVIGAPVTRAKRLYNMACVLKDGKIIHEYAKRHLPNYRVFDEKRYFRRGGSATDSHRPNSSIVEINGHKVGLLICEDIWRKGPAKTAKAEGAEVLFVLNASPFRTNKTKERIELLEKRSKKNALDIVYSNLVGGQDELIFDGGSLIVSQQGKLLLQAPNFESGLFTHTLLDESPQNFITPLEQNNLKNIYDALVLGVKDYVDKNGFPGIILGLSGGIDSALTMAIAVDALGAENVEAIMMPFRYTADISKYDAAQQAKTQSVKYREIPIENIFESFMTALSAEFEGLERDVTEENIQARSRGVLLMAMSNKLGKMLLATGNKSEMAVGYATLYGDMAGGYAPLKDVFKTTVYDLARFRNEIGDGTVENPKYKEIIPDRVITRPPSAELAPDQVDEDSLPPYDILDAVLRMFIEEFQSVEDIVAQGYDAEMVERVANMVLLNEYKRRQSAPGIRITKRAFGKDRRYPITSHYRWNMT